MHLFRFLALALLTLTVSAKLTEEEKKILREAADEADKHIRQVTREEVPGFIATGYHLLFFGAVWCRITQRFTPQWLTIQDEFDRRGWNTVPGFGIAKVQCAYEAEPWCVDVMGIHDGYPGIMLYKDGQFLEEYQHTNDYDNIMTYLEHVYNLIKAVHVENEVHQDIIAEVEKPKEEGPIRKPVHHKIGQIEHLDDDMLDLDAVDENVYQKELQHQIKEYNDELSYVRISGILVLSIACFLAFMFVYSKYGGLKNKSRGDTRYQQLSREE